jgi:hypothetical protein
VSHRLPLPRSVGVVLRIGFVGTGLIAWAHGLGLQAMIDAGVIEADVSVVLDRSAKRAQGFAAAHGAEVVGDLPGLMERCDAVWVCTPTVAHRSAVDAALSGGRAIFWSTRSPPPACRPSLVWSCARPRCFAPCARWWRRGHWDGR